MLMNFKPYHDTCFLSSFIPRRYSSMLQIRNKWPCTGYLLVRWVNHSPYIYISGLIRPEERPLTHIINIQMKKNKQNSSQSTKPKCSCQDSIISKRRFFHGLKKGGSGGQIGPKLFGQLVPIRPPYWPNMNQFGSVEPEK